MLNTKQQEAVNFKNGQMLVVSCPGSGKTTVIVARVHQLIESGVNPSNILIITFTKEAADQMQKRYEKEYGPTQAFFGTIHSGCLPRHITIQKKTSCGQTNSGSSCLIFYAKKSVVRTCRNT